VNSVSIAPGYTFWTGLPYQANDNIFNTVLQEMLAHCTAATVTPGIAVQHEPSQSYERETYQNLIVRFHR
jgi:hypothetical protein